METKELTVVRIIRKEKDHMDGTPLMKYKLRIVYDPQRTGRGGEILTKYYADDPRLTVGKMYAIQMDGR